MITLLLCLPLSLRNDLKLLAGYRSSRSKLYSDFLDWALFSKILVAKSSIYWSWDDTRCARCFKFEVISLGFFFEADLFSILVKSFITLEVSMYDDDFLRFEDFNCGDCFLVYILLDWSFNIDNFDTNECLSLLGVLIFPLQVVDLLLDAECFDELILFDLFS